MNSNGARVGHVVPESPGDDGGHARRLLWFTIAALALVVAVAAAGLVVAARDVRAAREAHGDLQRARDAVEHLQAALSNLQDAETGERGYVITGRDSFLTPYHAAQRSLAVQLNELERQPVDPQSRALLAEFTTLARRQLQFLANVVETRRSQGRDAAIAIIEEETGKQQMERLRQIMASIDQREKAVIAERLARFEERTARSERMFPIALASAILLVIVAGLALVRHTHRRIVAEGTARNSLDLLTAAIENLTQGVVVLDREERLVACNQRFIELRGLDEKWVRKGMRLAEFLPAGPAMQIRGLRGDGSTVDSRELPASLHGMEQGFDTEATRADGVVMQVRGRPMPGGLFVVTYMDVSALKASESAYRDQATRLASILDNVVDAIITINESGSIESWSKGAERMLGYTADEVLRRNVRMLMPDPHRSAHDGYVRRYLQTGERRIIGTRREVEALHKDGHRIPVDLGISEMRIGSRRLFIGIVRDISARLEVERLKTGFVSTVSHELRTPLTSISGSLGLLAGGVAGALPPKAARLIDIARLNSDRLVRLINDILDLEKAESGQLDFRLESQRLKPIVQHAIDVNRGYAHSFGAVIELSPQSADAAVLVDRDRLVQVLTNLLSNAAKFSPRGGVIAVDIAREHDRVNVTVRDQGPGISEEFRKRIFQKFAQADSSDARAKGGTGLGLSIVKTIVERLGGAVSFESAAGEGTAFRVSLPIQPEISPMLPTPTGTFPGPAVLICEDDPDVARILSDLLNHEGMRAQTVPTARAARAALDALRFDVAIVDLHLPDVDGLEFITELRARAGTRSLPVIVLTARSRGASDAEIVSSLQLADWLQKPIDPQRLLDAIRNVLAQPRDRRARILHVEDDESLTQLVHELLIDDAEVVPAHSLASARLSLVQGEYDLIILDITLGDGSGLDLLPELRTFNRTAPPVILYSATEASREITGMVHAALVKSRHPVEQLLANVRRLAQQPQNANNGAAGTERL